MARKMTEKGCHLLTGAAVICAAIAIFSSCEPIPLSPTGTNPEEIEVSPSDFDLGVIEQRCSRKFYAKLCPAHGIDSTFLFPSPLLESDTSRFFRSFNFSIRAPWDTYSFEPSRYKWFTGDSLIVTAWNTMDIHAFSSDSLFTGVNVFSSNPDVVQVERISNTQYRLGYVNNGYCTLTISTPSVKKSVTLYSKERIPLKGLLVRYNGYTRLVRPEDAGVVMDSNPDGVGLTHGAKLELLTFQPHNCSWRMCCDVYNRERGKVTSSTVYNVYNGVYPPESDDAYDMIGGITCSKYDDYSAFEGANVWTHRTKENQEPSSPFVIGILRETTSHTVHNESAGYDELTFFLK